MKYEKVLFIDYLKLPKELQNVVKQNDSFGNDRILKWYGDIDFFDDLYDLTFLINAWVHDTGLVIKPSIHELIDNNNFITWCNENNLDDDLMMIKYLLKNKWNGESIKILIEVSW